MLRAKLMAGKAVAVSANTIALALAVREDDEELQGLDKGECNEMFGLEPEARDTWSEWVNDERRRIEEA